MPYHRKSYTALPAPQSHHSLRSSVVGNIEKTLEENQVQAVVYDQQAVENDEIEELAKQYKISIFIQGLCL